MRHLLGIDYGTSQFKVQLYDLTGKPLAVAGGGVPVDRSGPGWVEQDMEKGWQVICRTIREVVERATIDPRSIMAIGTTGTTNINLLNDAGRALRPAILYGDERIPQSEDLRRIKEDIGEQRIGSGLGFDTLDDPTWTILLRLLASSKLLWMQKNEPEVFNQARTCVTTSWDFINARLTGVVSHWDNSLETDRLILEGQGLPEEFFGEARKTGEVVGLVSKTGAAECGLTAGIPVVMGATDSLCSFLGAGINHPEMGLNAAGTTDVVAVSTAGRPHSSVGYPVRYLFDNLWLLSLSPIRGPTLMWLRDTLLSPQSSYADLDDLAAQAPPGAGGLQCLPYFSGEKGLVHDPIARGAFLGLNLHHKRSHMARAGLEGIAFSLRQILTAYNDQGVAMGELRLCGGGARSELWNQIKADILGREIQVMQVLETGCLGVAMIASVAAGIFDDLSAASRALVKVSQVVEPDLSLQEMYEESYLAYLSIYPAIRASFAPLHELATARNIGAN